MRVRPALASDIEAVAELDRAVFGPDAWSPAQVEEELLRPRRRAWVVGEPVVGYIVTLDVGDGVDLQRIAVHADHRRRGLAHDLLTAALAAAAGRRMLLEVSVANDVAIAFYEATGFAPINRRRRYYGDGTDAVVLERRPAPSTAAHAED